MNAGYVIRKASCNDINGLISLLKALFAVEHEFEFDGEKQYRGLEMMLRDPGGCCIMLAETEDQIVGMCSAQLLVSTAEGGFAALVEDMIVSEQYRRKGIARDLLSLIGKWAYENGAYRLELLVDRRNTVALEFYKNLSWRETELKFLLKKLR